MWSHYANCHTGTVLEVSHIEDGKYASAWGAAKPVKYFNGMPLLADDDAMFLSLAKQKSLAVEKHFFNSVYVKANDWSYEKEWRVIGGWDKSTSTEDIPFRPKELTAVYLGCRRSDANRKQLRDRR